MAAALGVDFVPVDIEGVRNEDLAAMYTFLERTGYQVDIPALRSRFPDVAWTSFAAWARA